MGISVCTNHIFIIIIKTPYQTTSKYNPKDIKKKTKKKKTSVANEAITCWRYTFLTNCPDPKNIFTKYDTSTSTFLFCGRIAPMDIPWVKTYIAIVEMENSNFKDSGSFRSNVNYCLKRIFHSQSFKWHAILNMDNVTLNCF